MKLPTGELICLPVSNHFAAEAFVTHADVDWGSEKLFYSLLEGKGVFLDVGAHIGYYSLYVLPRVQAVYSFEPHPGVRVFLQQNLDKKANIEIIPCAVGATPGKASFTLELVAEISHLSGAEEKGDNQIEVDVVTVDAFVAARTLTVEAIKIDVEGHDLDVIRGSMAVLATQKPLVLTEAKPEAALFELMHQVGYRVFAYVRHPRTRRKSFLELFSDTLLPGDTKMLFLTPDRLAEKLIGQADRP
jgi:FkbM family methyltransferase